MKNREYRRTELESGLTIISERMDFVRSVALGFFSTFGARNEEEGKRGVTHFFEHMIFKGTEKRSAKDIAVVLEERGGNLDAMTSKDFISVYAKVLDEDTALSVDVIGDLLTHPVFPESEIEKEKTVVLEEYRAYKDSPDDYVFQLLFEALFSGHPLSYEVVGYPETIKSFGRGDLLEHWNKVANPANSFVAAAGNIEHNRLVELVSKYFHFKNAGVITTETECSPPMLDTPKTKTMERLRQVHFACGFIIPPFKDERRYPIMILNSILGVGMSSRLFQHLREDMGLVYSVNSFVEFYKDYGVLAIYFSLEPHNLTRAFTVLLKEIQSLKENGIQKKELEMAKKRVRGSVVLSEESTISRMTRIANLELYIASYIPIDESLKKFDSVSIEDIKDVIDEFLTINRMGIGLVGPEGTEKWKPMV